MDANKFMTEYQRMCTSYVRCADCPLYADKPCAEIPSRYTKEFSSNLIKAVEDWSSAHPVTRQDLFKKIYPNAVIDQDGVLGVCPKLLDKTFDRCGHYVDCTTCHQKYWLKEVQ